MDKKKKRKPYLGMHFRCCHVYVRLYMNRAGTAYEGNCPKCAAKAAIKIGPGGSSERFWSSD